MNKKQTENKQEKVNNTENETVENAFANETKSACGGKNKKQ